MTDLLDRLKTALADRYAIEREIGADPAAGLTPCKNACPTTRLAVPLEAVQ